MDNILLGMNEVDDDGPLSPHLEALLISDRASGRAAY